MKCFRTLPLQRDKAHAKAYYPWFVRGAMRVLRIFFVPEARGKLPAQRVSGKDSVMVGLTQKIFRPGKFKFTSKSGGTLLV